jgi:hypothetical protein
MIFRSPRKGASTAPVILIIDADRDFLTDSLLVLIQAGYEVLTPWIVRKSNTCASYTPNPLISSPWIFPLSVMPLWKTYDLATMAIRWSLL